MNYYTFRTIIEPDKNNTFHGWVPSLKGCHTWGETIEETKINLKEAIKAYILSLKDDNEKIPQENGLEYFETISESEFLLKNSVKNSYAEIANH